MKKIIYFLFVVILAIQVHATVFYDWEWVISENSMWFGYEANGASGFSYYVVVAYARNTTTGQWYQVYDYGSSSWYCGGWMLITCGPWDGIKSGLTEEEQLRLEFARSLRDQEYFVSVLNILHPDGIENVEFAKLFMDFLEDDYLESSAKNAAENDQNAAEGAEPVYLSNGEFSYSVTDFIIPGRGVSIDITRTYGSRREYNGRFGYGWNMNYNIKAKKLIGDLSIILVDGSGEKKEYVREGLTNKYSRSMDKESYFLVNGDECDLIWKNGFVYIFNSVGNLSRIEDKNGNFLSFEYDQADGKDALFPITGYSQFFMKEDYDGPADRYGLVGQDYKLRSIVDSLGREVEFHYDDDDGTGAGLVDSITDVSTGRVWAYYYDSSYNNLIQVQGPSVADPENSGSTYNPTTTYEYENSNYPHVMTGIIDPEHNASQESYITNTFTGTTDDIKPQIVSQIYDPTEDEDAEYQFQYDWDNNRSILGSRENVTYQSNTTSKSYTVTVYNDAGQTDSETIVKNPSDDDTACKAFTTAYEYNDYNDITQVILPQRNCVQYDRWYVEDSNGFNLESITVIQRPECDVLPFNGTSDSVQVTDSGTYAFNKADFSIAFWVKRLQDDTEEILFDKRDADDDGWCLKFDASNHVVLSVNTVDVTSTTTIADTGWHYVVASVDSDSSAQIYIDGGSAEGSVDPNSPTLDIASDLYMGRCSYSAAGYFRGSLDEVMILNTALVNREDTFGLSRRQNLVGYWKMDDNAENTAVIDSSTSVLNGVAARNTALMVADGKVPGQIATTTEFSQYNGLDYARTLTDPKGNSVTYTYDFDDPNLYGSSVGNLMKVTCPQADVYQRNASDELVYASPQPAVEMHFTYLDHGQIDTITSPDGMVTKYIYYPDDYATLSYRGRVYQLIIDYGDSSHRNIVTEYTYDAMGHVNRVTQDAGGLNISSDLFYNALDQLVQMTQPVLSGQTAGYTTVYNYTKNGKPWQVKQDFTDGDNAAQTQTVEYSYTLLDNLKTITDSLSRTTTMNYDNDENVISVVDPKGAVEGYAANATYDFRGLKQKVTDAEGNETTYTYNPNGTLKTVTDANDQVTQYNYDTLDRLTQAVYPDNSTESYTYDIAGGIVAKETRKGDRIYFDYDAMNRQVRRIIDDSLTLDVLITDNSAASGNWESQTSALGKYGSSCLVCDDAADVYSFQTTVDDETAYTAYLWWPEIATADAVTVRIKDDSTTLATLTIDQTQKSAQWVKLSTSGYTFSSGTAVVEVVSQGSGAVTAADAIRLVPASFSMTEFYYDIAGRVLQMDKDSQKIEYFYDSLGRVEEVLDSNSRSVQYQYDNLGRRTRLTYPDDSYITYHYDAMSRLTDIKDPNGIVIAHYAYDQLSRRTALFYNYNGDPNYNDPNDGLIYYDYEDAVTDPQTENNLGNRLEAILHDIDNDGISDLSYTYTYDAVGNCQTKVIDSMETHSYLYDKTYQLTQDQTTGGDRFNWVYDAVCNWEYVNLNDSPYRLFEIASGNKLNQYTAVNSVSYAYDDNGNLTSDGTYTYSYDAENRLLSVSQSGTPVVTYGYDVLGRRISKTAGTSTIKYCYDGDHVIAEYDGSGTLLRKFIYNLGIDEPICMIVPGQTEEMTYFYHQDALGSVVALSKYNSSTGIASFVEKYSYSAFGETTVTLNGSTGNPYRFTGREYESETGLYYYRARFYNPAIGRFLQTDPVGYYDSTNLYQYCGNNPLNFIDPYGLCKSGGWLDWVQGGLDVIGIFDPFGIADGANALIYLARGDYINAGISALAIIPYIGDLGKAGKYGAKGIKYLDKAADVNKVSKSVGGLNLYKWGDRAAEAAHGWKEGDYFLYLPNKGSAKLNWKQNASALRKEMQKGNPIYETYVDAAGNLKPTTGFLNAERNLLTNHGWFYNPDIKAWIK